MLCDVETEMLFDTLLLVELDKLTEFDVLCEPDTETDMLSDTDSDVL